MARDVLLGEYALEDAILLPLSDVRALGATVDGGRLSMSPYQCLVVCHATSAVVAKTLPVHGHMWWWRDLRPAPSWVGSIVRELKYHMRKHGGGRGCCFLNMLVSVSESSPLRMRKRGRESHLWWLCIVVVLPSSELRQPSRSAAGHAPGSRNLKAHVTTKGSALKICALC